MEKLAAISTTDLVVFNFDELHRRFLYRAVTRRMDVNRHHVEATAASLFCDTSTLSEILKQKPQQALSGTTLSILTANDCEGRLAQIRVRTEFLVVDAAHLAIKLIARHHGVELKGKAYGRLIETAFDIADYRVRRVVFAGESMGLRLSDIGQFI